MRLKLDENIDPRAEEVLVQGGHDVLTVPQEELSGSQMTSLQPPLVTKDAVCSH